MSARITDAEKSRTEAIGTDCGELYSGEMQGCSFGRVVPCMVGNSITQSG